MNRTILIIVGLLCAVITAAGIMWYNNDVYYTTGQLGVFTSIPPLDNKEPVSQVKEIKETKKNKDEIVDFTGTVTEIDTWNSPRRSRQDWFIRIKIKELTTNTQTIQPGKELVYFVHSPFEFFNEPREQAVSKDYKFRASCSRNEKGEVTIPSLRIMDEIFKQRPLLHDKDASVRRNALSVLVHEYDTESIPEIKNLLNDENEQIRKDAAEALDHFDRLEKYRKKAKEGK